MGGISNLSSSHLQSLLGSALQNAGLTPNTTSNSPNGTGAVTGAQPADNSQISPFAQLISTLQQLQQSDPAKYKQVTLQIATNLQNAAQTAQSQGNTAAATQLTQLAADFTTASQTGQLPNIQDLAQATGGHHHHHHSHAASADSDSNANSTSSSSGASNNNNVGLPVLQTNGAQTDPLNPLSIIFNTLSSAGISSSL